MIGIVVQCIDYDKYSSCSLLWDCIAFDKLSYAMHWNALLMIS